MTPFSTQLNLSEAVYNVPLDTAPPALSRDGIPLPWIVLFLIEHIRSFGMKEEGIFEFPGDKKEVDRIRNISDRVSLCLCDALCFHFIWLINFFFFGIQCYKDIDLSKFQIKSVADALRLWLELLPDPPIPIQICDSLLLAYGKISSNTLNVHVLLSVTHMNQAKSLLRARNGAF